MLIADHVEIVAVTARPVPTVHVKKIPFAQLSAFVMMETFVLPIPVIRFSNSAQAPPIQEQDAAIIMPALRTTYAALTVNVPDKPSSATMASLVQLIPVLVVASVQANC